MLNQVLFSGRIVSKPHLQIKGDLQEAYLIVHVESEKNAQDHFSTFVSVLVRGKHAESCYLKLEVNSEVLVEGNLFHSPENEGTIILAKRVQFLD